MKTHHQPSIVSSFLAGFTAYGSIFVDSCGKETFRTGTFADDRRALRGDYVAVSKKPKATKEKPAKQ